MNRRVVCQSLLGAAALAVLLLALGLLLRPAVAAPRAQEEGGPELTLVKMAAGDGTIAAGQTVRFTLIVTNTGDVTATNVVVRDDYDQVALPTIRVLSEGAPGGTGGQNDGDVITWQLGDLPPRGSRTLNWEATAAQAFAAGTTEVSNVASAQADNVAATVQATVNLAIQAPQLTLSLERTCVSGEEQACPGATVRYTIRYTNNGNVDAANVVLEVTFSETVVQQVQRISGGGVQDGATLRWSLGTVGAGIGDEVSYELVLKPALTQGAPSEGTVELRTEATIEADGVQPATATDTFTLDMPILSIERERTDLNGDPIEPGDTLRFTIRFGNSGAVAASDVVVRDDYEEGVVAGLSSISAGGREADGAVEWVLTELGPGAEQTVSYDVRLITAINESKEVDNTAIIYVRGTELMRYGTKMTVEPGPPGEEGEQVFQREPVAVALLVGTSTVIALLIVGLLTYAYLQKTEGKQRAFRFGIEGVAVVVIVEAVLVLAMNKSIEPDGAVTILSGIAGYLLGRGISEAGGGGSG